MKNFTLLILFTAAFSALRAQLPTETPHSPDLETVYIGDGIIQATISNSNPNTNNANEDFSVFDPVIEDDWNFEGYLIYQVIIPFPSFDPTNPNYFRLVGQSDIQNEYGTLVNQDYNLITDMCEPTVMVEGSNQGIETTYNFDTDAFTGQPFEEDQFYCFVAFSYATNPDGDDGSCDGPSQFIRSSTDANGEQLIICSTVMPTSVDEISMSNIQIANPMSDELIVNSTWYEAKIFNSMGQQLQSLTPNQNQLGTHLSPGMYVVAVRTPVGWIRRTVIKG